MRILFAVAFMLFGLAFFAKAVLVSAGDVPIITTLAPLPTPDELPFLGLPPAPPVEDDVPPADSKSMANAVARVTATPPSLKLSAPEPASDDPDSAGIGGITIIVGTSDTIEILAKRYDVSIEAILRANGYKGPRALSPGQRLIIPPRPIEALQELTSKKASVPEASSKGAKEKTKPSTIKQKVFAAKAATTATEEQERPRPSLLAAASARPTSSSNLKAPSSMIREKMDVDEECRKRMRKLGVVYSDKCVDVSDIVKDLAVGTYSFNRPVKAYVDDPFHLSLALKTANQPEAAAKQEKEVASHFMSLQGTVESRDEKYAQSITATLHADDIAVFPVEPQTRTATTEAPIIWDWTITPRSEGNKTLAIEVVANILVGKDRHPVSVRTLRQEITIEVSYFRKVKMYVAAVNGYILAASGTIAAIAGIIGFVPPVRRFVLAFWSRRKEAPRYGR